MSRIVTKAFDASKKIIRTIFRGSPNLFTTSDLNRQIEALKWQIDSVERRIGATHDVFAFANVYGKNLTVFVNLSFVEVAGCRFSFPYNGGTDGALKASFTLDSLGDGKYICVVLTANKKEVTYADDFKHEISGASFEDGTYAPAADAVIYENPRIEIQPYRQGLEPSEKFIALLADIFIDTDGKITQMFRVYGGNSRTLPFEAQGISRVSPNPSQAFTNIPTAISSFAESLRSLGNHLYSGKAMWTDINDPNSTELSLAGKWIAVTIGKVLLCSVIIDKGYHNFTNDSNIRLMDFEKWRFIDHVRVPVNASIRILFQKRISLATYDSSQTKEITDSDYPTPVFLNGGYVANMKSDNEAEIPDLTPLPGPEPKRTFEPLIYLRTPTKDFTGYGLPLTDNSINAQCVFSFTTFVWNHEGSEHDKNMDY